MPTRGELGERGRGEGLSEESGPRDGIPDLPWELPSTFLGLEGEEAAWDRSRAFVLPVPDAATTSFGGGTRLGPRAILDASRYVELYDQELGVEPVELGVHTLPALELSREGPAAAMAELEKAYGRILDAAGDRFPILLGGEHSVTGPPVRVQASRNGGRISLLQMDAHADLRASYEGSPHSHASVTHGVLDAADVVAVGVRGISSPEVEVARERGVTLIYAEEMAQGEDWMDRALKALGDPVYLTFDVDYFDPSLIPSTGTPEPGGGHWYPTLRFLRRVFRERTVVALDVVEHAPIPALHAPDFTVAKLVYKLMGYRFEWELAGGRGRAGGAPAR